jgi:hypothetical protein
MGMPAWDDAASELCSQLMCEGRLWRPSAEGSSLTPRVPVGVRRRDEGRSTSMREAAGKKWAMSLSHDTRTRLGEESKGGAGMLCCASGAMIIYPEGVLHHYAPQM